jgi:hypothetical protein
VRVRGVEPFTIDVLPAHLDRSGFALTLEPQAAAQSGALGLFFADRRSHRG